MPYPQFDRSKLRLQPLAEAHDLTSASSSRSTRRSRFTPHIPRIAEHGWSKAKSRGASRILNDGRARPAAGAHRRHLIDLMERDGEPHRDERGRADSGWEFALDRTSYRKSVARCVSTGEFGL